jgi:hypothetical protein
MNEQRSTRRYHLPFGPRRQLFVLGTDEVLKATVTDVSSEGIAFVSCTPVEVGTHIVMDVLSDRHPPRHMEHLRVIRTGPLEDGQWLCGCSFIRDV